VKCSACQKDVPPGRFCLQCGAALSSAPRFGDYEVDGVIGEGGMGRVFKAKQPRLKRVVCIKTLLPQFASDEAVVTRFEREATTTATLKHPNIVSIIDVERGDDGVPFIVMEYVEGRSLRQLLRDEAPLSPARAVALVDQVLAGLAEAHAHGIVHRDLKPSNVLVEALKDGTELCKVLDFGIARTIGGDTTDPQLTRTGMMLGTPGYMAPEQISSSDFDHRVDLYAAGVILYELLTGGRMVRAPNETELLKKTLLEDPPAPSSRTSTNVPAALDTTVLKAVARDPKTRFSSAGEFREVLGRSLGSSVSVFTNPALQVQLDTTSLAQAATDTASNDVTNPRALLTAVLGTSEGGS
jgi:eukaryotic-like serine/threonine-protein kinase